MTKPLPERLTEKPIHRFGVDGFALFNLPAPLFGQVNGILGVNAVGKSTALRVLAQTLKPNMGRVKIAGKETVSKQAEINELIAMFKGSEAQIFFEKIKSKQAHRFSE